MTTGQKVNGEAAESGREGFADETGDGGAGGVQGGADAEGFDEGLGGAFFEINAQLVGITGEGFRTRI